MEKLDITQWLIYLLPAFSYIIGSVLGSLKIPKEIRQILTNREIINIIAEGIKAADDVRGRSDIEKREHVRAWAKNELFKRLGKWLPDSVINYLIEHIIVSNRKAKSK